MALNRVARLVPQYMSYYDCTNSVVQLRGTGHGTPLRALQHCYLCSQGLATLATKGPVSGTGVRCSK